MIALVLTFLAGAVAQGSAGITYQGRLLGPDGQPVVSSTVQFKIQIRTPGSENCLLYEEQQTKNLSASRGIFALNINDGTATVVNTEPFTLDRAFQNRGTFSFGAGKCTGGTVYTPNPTDGRRLVVEFNDGTFAPGTWEQMPAQAINFVPMALESLTVGGFAATGLVRVVDGSGAPAMVTPLTQTQHNQLMDILNGTGDIGGQAQGFNGSLAGDVSGSQGNTRVTKIQGRAVDNTTPTHGQALVWNGIDSRWEPGTVSGGGGGGGGTVLSVTGTSPVTVNNADAANPVVGIADASESVKGAVLLAADGDTSAGKAVQGSDARLHDARAPTGAAGGDLTGNYPNPTIAKLQNRDVTLAALATGDVLKYDGVKWVNAAPAADSDTLGGMSCGNGDVAFYDGGWTCLDASVSSSADSLVRRDAGGVLHSASADFGSLQLNNGGGGVLTLQTPVAFTSYSLRLPPGAGTNGQILTSNGTGMVWSNANGLTVANVSGTVAVANGGTGATTASGARTNLGITATGDALVTAADAAAARTAISAMQNVTPGSNGNVLTVAGGVWTSAPFTVNAANVGSSVGGYFTYKPNNGACASGEVLKWETAGGGRWACGTDISSTGGTGVASVSATAPVTVDNTDPNNPRVEIDDATTSSTGVVQLATSSDTTAGLVVQANDTRLTNSRAPSGAAGGDLTGNYPNPTIAKLQTKDVTLTGLASGDVLRYDGVKWVNAASSDTLGGLSCASGDVASYSGSTWTCAATSVTATNDALVRRSGAGQIQASSAELGSLALKNGGGSVLTLSTPVAFTTYTLKLPSGTGSSGQILTSNGTDMIWSNANSITAANVSGTVAIANGGTGATSASAARSNLGISATGDSLVTASSAANARTAIGAMAAVTAGTSGQVLTSNGSAWISSAVPSDSTKVTKSGDTMTGTLNLPSNGLVVGSTQLVVSGAKVGIGTATPSSTLDVIGDIEFTGTITDVSDRRFKHDIRPLDGALERLALIEPRAYRMNDRPDCVEYGVIAQDAEKVFPELVRTKDDEMKSKSVNYLGFIAWIIEAVKELRGRDLEGEAARADLRADVERLKLENERLRRRLDGLEAALKDRRPAGVQE